MARDGERSARSARVTGSGSGGPSGEARDRISDLPDGLLLRILHLLPLVEAIRTCFLSKRWINVWTSLPVLLFNDLAVPAVKRFPDLVDSSLRRYATDVNMRDLSISLCEQANVDAARARLAFWATVAAQRVTGRFNLFLLSTTLNLEGEERTSLNLPCFEKAMDISIDVGGLELKLPEAGTFTRLSKLFISGVHFTDDGAAISDVVSRRCPCLQSLELTMIRGVRVLTFHAKSLLNLRLSVVFLLERLQVIAANLGKLHLENCFASSQGATALCLRAPALEEFHWSDRYPDELRECRFPSCLKKLIVVEVYLDLLLFIGGRSNFTKILQLFSRADFLQLNIPIEPDLEEYENHMSNVKLPYCSELELCVTKNGHKFGPTIAHLLKKNSHIRKLSLKTYHREDEYISCVSNCECRQPSNWEDQEISLDYLELVVFNEFGGTHDERNFVYYIMRNTKELRKLSIVFSTGVDPTKRFLRKLHKLAMSTSGCIIELHGNA